jgi:hypothetical protein
MLCTSQLHSMLTLPPRASPFALKTSEGSVDVLNFNACSCFSMPHLQQLASQLH